MKHKLLSIVAFHLFVCHKIMAQSGLCDPVTPFFNCNLSGQPAGTWLSSPPVQRSGNCCGTSAPDRCIEFQITLDPSAIAINFNIASGAVPPGAMYYQINCGQQIPVGQPICLNGPGPYTLTFCKPGNNVNTYAITSIPGPLISPPDTTSEGCSASASVSGLNISSITWTSIAPGSVGQYNSYLSCTSACSSVTVSPTGTSYPAYVDYKVCGTPAANACLGNTTFCDTVRIHFNPPLLNTINPNPAVFCSSSGGIMLTGSVNGGVPPYQIKWKNASGALVGTSSTYFATSIGTYSFEVYDANTPACPPQVTTVTVTQEMLPVLDAGPDQTICAGNPIQLNGSVQNSTTYQWTGGNGTFSPNRNTLNATYTPSATEINNGSVTLTLVSNATANCPGVSDQVTFTIKPPLTVAINGPSIMCYGQSYNLISSVGGGTSPYSYLWSTGATTSSLANITAGSYTLTVTDATPGNSCSATAGINIIQNPPINVNANSNSLVSCNVTANITASANGGSGSFTYLWNTGSSATTISVYSGNYTVTATDVNGCTGQNTVSIITPNSTLTSSITGSTQVCYNATTTLTAMGNGGFGNYSYAWSTGSTGNSITVPAGNYCVNITDANGCVSSTCVTVNQSTQVAPTISAPALICQGANASIMAQTSGGTQPYSYSWSTGALSSGISEGVGNYTVTVTDANGCTGNAAVTIANEPSLNLSMSNQEVNCFGESNGSASVTVSGGVAPYSYSWSWFGNATSSITNIPAGTYTVTITDALGCIQTGNTTVTEPSPIALTATGTNTTCYGGNNGSAIATATGGTPPYQYAWSNGQSTATATGLSQGTYSITVTGTHGCTTNTSVTINQPSQITCSISVVSPISCNGSSSGSLGVIANGGTAPYTYSWSTTPSQTSSTASNLSAGSYTVTITDNNNCVVSNGSSLINPPPFSASILSLTHVSCYGGSNGGASIIASGGQAPYSYNWSTSGIGGSSISNLTAGSYSVIVSDNLGCSQTLNFTITQPAAVLSLSTGSSQLISCSGSTVINASVSGGTSPYTYSWNTGATTSSLNVSSSGNFSVTVTDNKGCLANSSVNVSFISSTLSVNINAPAYLCAGQQANITAVTSGGNGSMNFSWNNGGVSPTISVGVGNYCVTVTDQDGCMATDCRNMQEEPLLTASNISSKACPLGNATLTANVNGGVSPYSYLWSTSETSASINAPSGSYTYTVTDANGCSQTAAGMILQTTALNIFEIAHNNVSCFGGNNGYINISTTGGTSPYSYSWTPVNSTSTMIYNLGPGSYTVTVTDSLGCSDNETYIITQPAQALNLSTTHSNVNCYGGNNGSAGASVSGGTPAYSYLWGNGDTTNSITSLPAGSYSVWITDANGCLLTNNTQITQPGVLNLTNVSTSNALCNGQASGAATFSSSGGTRPIQYTWSNGVTDSTSNTLFAGTYTVLIIDANGCRDSSGFNITQPAPLTYIPTINPAKCTNSNGSINIHNVTGGTANYSMNWYDNYTAFFHTGLLPGDYYFTITDGNGCQLSDTLTVPQQNIQLNVNLTKTDIDCKENLNGSIAASVSNGSIPFVYSWSNGAQTTGINSLQTGSYDLTVTDANGCTGTDSISIFIQYYIDISATQPNQVCVYDSVLLSVNGANNYSWYNSANTFVNSGPQYLVVPSASETFTVVGFNNICTDTAVINLNTLPRPLISAGSDTGHCYGQIVQLNASGAVSYVWSPATGLNTITTANPIVSGNQTQQYIVEGTDINGCKNKDTILVAAFSLPVLFLSIQDSICKGASSQFTGGGGISYNWSPSATLTSSSGSMVNASPVNNTTYTLVVTNADGCTDDSTFTLHVIQPPVISITGNQPVCKGDSVTLSASGASSYQWSPTQNISSTNTAITSVSPSTDIYYYVTGSFHGCSNTDSVLINLLPLPTVDAGADLNICTGGSISLDGSGTGNIFWTPSSGLSSSTTLDPVATPSQTTYYTLTITDPNGCSDTSGVFVFVNPIPVADFNAPPVCFGETTSFTNLATISSGSISSYYWSFGDNNGTSILNNPTYHYDTCGNFSVVMVANSDKNCMDIKTRTVNVFCLPIIQFSENDTILCEGENLLLQNYSILASSYLWTFGDGNMSSTGNPNHMYSDFGNYTVTLTGTNAAGCKDSLSQQIIVNDKPEADYIPENVCIGSITHFQGITTISDGFVNQWLWDFGSLGISNQQNPTVNFVNTGNFAVSLIATSDKGCADTISKTVYVYPRPNISVIANNGCFGTTSSFQAYTTGAPVVNNWAWDFNQDGVADAGSANPTFLYPTIGPQQIELIGTGINGCDDTVRTNITIYPQPIADFTTRSKNSCAPACFSFKDSSYSLSPGINITQWHWQVNGVNIPAADSLIYCTDEGQQIDVGLQVASDQGCLSQFILKNDYLEAYPKPNADFSYSPEKVTLINSVVSFNNLTTNANSYSWDFGDNSEYSGSNELNPVYQYNDTGNYIITLIARSGYSCTDTVMKYLHVDNEFTIYVPNAFTPNEDKTNEIFKPYGFGFYEKEGYEFIIFDRWGDQIFVSRDYNIGWDGRANDGDEIAQMDVYVYKIKVKEIATDKTHKFTGIVTLVR